jgi:Mor family transcriptional regulator
MWHRHHIIPRHEWKKRFGNLQGFNANDNVVCLTWEQHAQAHRLLFELNNNPYDNIAAMALSRLCSFREATKMAQRLSGATRKGTKLSLESRAKMSQAHKGRKFTLEHRAAMSVALRGMPRGPMPAIVREKISKAQMGRPGVKGRIFTAETCAKISLSKLGKKLPLSQCQAISQSLKGHKFTLERRAAMSVSQCARWKREHTMARSGDDQ